MDWKLSKTFRELEGDGEQTPIVAITAYDVYGMEEAALETGCNKYLRKPLDLDELDRTLKSLGFFRVKRSYTAYRSYQDLFLTRTIPRVKPSNS